jgi:hypothetical protein
VKPVDTVNLAPMTFRAAVRSVDQSKRTVEMIISTGAKVLREGWDGPFWEELSLEKKHVRMRRLNNGAPLLDSHGGWAGPTLGDQYGVVESARLEDTNDGPVMVGIVRFARAEDDPRADQAFRKVMDGIIRNVSVGYRTYKIEKVEGGEGTTPVFRATDWEPYEVSLVPMGADDGAKVRGEELQRNACQVVLQAATRAAAPPPPKPSKKESTMPPHSDDTRSETILEDDDPAPVERKADPPVPDVTEIAVGRERERGQIIRRGCRAARLPESFANKLIDDSKITLEMAQTRILDELAARGGDREGPGRTPSGASEVVVGDDPFVHKRKGIENALLHRAMPRVPEVRGFPAYGFELSEEGRQYRGLGLMDIADICLRARGVRVTSLSKMERATAVLSRAGGFHTITDFPNILADVMGKVLRSAYEAQPPTWGPIAKDVQLADFKPSKQLQLGDAPQLLEVMEHGEFTSGTIAEGKEQFQLKTYGRIFAITRQALINDDLNAFADVPAAFGRMARVKESDLAWAEITANPVMGDGVALFASAAPPTGHANLDTVNAAIAVATIGKGRAAMRVQKGLDLVTLLNLNPSYLIVPAALETVAQQFVSNSLMASAPGSVNPFAGTLQVIAEPRLDANSVTAWYLATAVSQVPVLFHGTLEGQPGPEVTQEQGFDVDGIRMKCRIDVAFKAADFHGVWKNVGV